MNFLVWVSDHIQLFGWPSLIVLTWKISGRFFDFKKRLENTETTVQLLATNHIPHLQAELEKLNEAIPSGFDQMTDAISGLRQDLLIIATKK